MNLEPDIVDWIRREFPADQFEQIADSVIQASESPRIRRCIAFASHGNIEHLNYFCKLAKIDYRDVINAGEYECKDTRLYDFNLPIDQASIKSES